MAYSTKSYWTDKESDNYKGFMKVCTEFGNKPNTYVQIE